MKNNFNLYFDMDDTIVDFGADRHKDDVKQVILEKGFYANLGPLPFLEEVNKLASVVPENVHIVSACVGTEFCVQEKIQWLKANLPAADKDNVIFTQIGENKAEIVAKRNRYRRLSKYDILIDDYSQNIKEWEDYGGTAIKFQNSFNTSDPSKYKYIIKDLSELLTVLNKIREDLE